MSPLSGEIEPRAPTLRRRQPQGCGRPLASSPSWRASWLGVIQGVPSSKCAQWVAAASHEVCALTRAPSSAPCVPLDFGASPETGAPTCLLLSPRESTPKARFEVPWRVAPWHVFSQRAGVECVVPRSLAPWRGAPTVVRRVRHAVVALWSCSGNHALQGQTISLGGSSVTEGSGDTY